MSSEDFLLIHSVFTFHRSKNSPFPEIMNGIKMPVGSTSEVSTDLFDSGDGERIMERTYSNGTFSRTKVWLIVAVLTSILIMSNW
jgi:hypothetical protein